MTDLPTLEAALKLADQDCPLPSLAGPALKVLRDHIREAHTEIFRMLVELAEAGGGCAKRGNFVASVDMGMDEVAGALVWESPRGMRHLLESRVLDTRLPPDASIRPMRDHPVFPVILSQWVRSSVDENGILRATPIPDSEIYTCWCQTCRPITLADMRFVVCPTCGNKRCPHANDHRNACTGSNEPGQEGSA